MRSPAHWDVLAAADFFTVEVWGLRGLVTYYVLFVIELSTRRVHFAGLTPNPDTAWMMQIGRNLTDPVDGFLRDKRFVIMDREGWGWVALGASAVGLLGTLFHRNRSPFEWLLPLGLAGAGVAVLLHEREKGIGRAEERIVAELDNLDPLARVQVMKRVASEQLERLTPGDAT